MHKLRLSYDRNLISPCQLSYTLDFSGISERLYNSIVERLKSLRITFLPKFYSPHVPRCTSCVTISVSATLVV
jgi:hypothetical protein